MKRCYIHMMLCLLLLSCSDKNNELESALHYAGTNRAELEKVLRYYEGDSLKYRAAVFLIENMPYHFGYDRNDRKIADCQTLRADYLIENIELAFQVREKAWNRDLPFADFCRYVLPYRCLYETPSKMRRQLMETYLPRLDSLRPKSIAKAARIIHAQFHLTFLAGAVPKHYPSVEEIYQTRTGKCDGMLLLSTHILRAVGIPATIDYTQWSHRDGSHFWGNVLNNNGEFLPYAPENEPPGELKEHLTHAFVTPPVVYRYEFAPYGNPVYPETDNYRTPLKNPLLHLVTTEYMAPTTSIQIDCDYPVGKGKRLVYLCHYNNRQWRPLLIGERKGKRCTFPEVVVDDIFIVAEEDRENPGTLRYVTHPFHVDSYGKIHKFRQNIDECISLFIPNLREEYADVCSTLAYWEENRQNFVRLHYLCDTLPDGYLLQGIPKNSLMRATIDRKGKMGGERVFFVQGDTIRRY